MSKPIYIGDKINLNIQGTSKDEILSSFKDYHIDKIDDKNNISFRTFKTGDNIINVGNSEINLKVASTLSKDDKDIYMNLSDMSNKNVNSATFPFIFFLGIILFLGSSVFLLKNILKRKKIVREIPIDERCKNTLESLSDENFPFEISLALREYIDSVCKSNFLGGIYKENNIISKDDIDFLKSLDYYKFSQNKEANKSCLKNKAFKLYHKLKGGENNV